MLYFFFIQINNRNNELSNSDATISTKPSFVFEDVSDEDIDGDQTQDELIPSPSEYDEYSGLSDDLDLGIQDNDDEEEEEQEQEMNESDNDVNKSVFCFSIFNISFFFQLNFEENGHLNGDDNESDDDDSSQLLVILFLFCFLFFFCIITLSFKKKKRDTLSDYNITFFYNEVIYTIQFIFIDELSQYEPKCKQK